MLSLVSARNRGLGLVIESGKVENALLRIKVNEASYKFRRSSQSKRGRSQKYWLSAQVVDIDGRQARNIEIESIDSTTLFDSLSVLDTRDVLCKDDALPSTVVLVAFKSGTTHVRLYRLQDNMLKEMLSERVPAFCDGQLTDGPTVLLRSQHKAQMLQFADDLSWTTHSLHGDVVALLGKDLLSYANDQSHDAVVVQINPAGVSEQTDPERTLIKNFVSPSGRDATCATVIKEGVVAVGFTCGRIVVYSQGAPRELISSGGAVPISLAYSAKMLWVTFDEDIQSVDLSPTYEKSVYKSVEGCLLVSVTPDASPDVLEIRSNDSLEFCRASKEGGVEGHERAYNQYLLHIEQHLEDRLRHGVEHVSNLAISMEAKKHMQQGVMKQMGAENVDFGATVPPADLVSVELHHFAGDRVGEIPPSKPFSPPRNHVLSARLGQSLLATRLVLWAEVTADSSVNELYLSAAGKDVAIEASIQRLSGEGNMKNGLLTAKVVQGRGEIAAVYICAHVPHLCQRMGTIRLGQNLSEMPPAASTQIHFTAAANAATVENWLKDYKFSSLAVDVQQSTEGLSRVTCTGLELDELQEFKTYMLRAYSDRLWAVPEPEKLEELLRDLERERSRLEEADVDESVAKLYENMQ
mmetsp:Transcript_8205/g.24691  ORF Transcript_8205/g.24691 Transcript_8205/m.24691 type:complete len:637 (-) Transcript_8205:1191-3101(-)|eukprot:CAMPEP_0198737870 /NCGR_PEP_ID=MMETSP1475-20131203/68086_1 /TAXON_ID= ORGANISM="Unidentified sp., Strain CCMP1999" /NCGR_SAMPLE_ID=MMETSP1475 /ASSEMBLY_ACC=CAM_ASM_001111 /LENGTH=636 /DNA_ID=CAMNT_0044501739 /DNA_START=125 /DNA_END=2035 /DNA_ORIENTATION=-